MLKSLDTHPASLYVTVRCNLTGNRINKTRKFSVWDDKRSGSLLLFNFLNSLETSWVPELDFGFVSLCWLKFFGHFKIRVNRKIS